MRSIEDSIELCSCEEISIELFREIVLSYLEKMSIGLFSMRRIVLSC